MEDMQKYVFRKIRPISHYEDFLNIDIKSIIEIKRLNYLSKKGLEQHFNDRKYTYIPEYDSYSDQMKRVLFSAFSASLELEANGKTNPRVYSFIKWVLGSYYRKGILKEPNIFDLELVKEMAILFKEGWPENKDFLN